MTRTTTIIMILINFYKEEKKVLYLDNIMH